MRLPGSVDAVFTPKCDHRAVMFLTIAHRMQMKDIVSSLGMQMDIHPDMKGFVLRERAAFVSHTFCSEACPMSCVCVSLIQHS